MEYTKYPRTYHLPYSLTITDDDKRLNSDEQFIGMNVIVTEKRDGENTTVYPNGYIHARSLDGNKHPWQAWLKKYIQTWYFDIPDRWRVCGENLYPQHSITYDFDRESQFFQVFGIYDDNNNCLSWDDTVQYCQMLNIEHVPVIYHGVYDKEKILSAFKEYSQKENREIEGFVVRNENAFAYDMFKKNTGKYVRANHVQTDEHWTQHWKPNTVKTI